MKKNTKLITNAVFASIACLAVPTFAAVSPEQAARLGQDLTPFGAEMAGNAEGTIPAWTRWL